jgi:hypothetical protein
MALNLSLSYQEQNDNKAIILTDTTDDYNYVFSTETQGYVMVTDTMYEIVSQAVIDFTTQGAPNNNVGTRFVATGGPTLGAGDSLKTLDTTITAVDGTPVVKSQVNLYATFGPFATQEDMVYTITAALLGDAAGSLLVDGLYALSYKLTYWGDGVINSRTDTLNVTILVYGQVKVATYEKLRAISTWYMCQDGRAKSEISEADLCGAYLASIENSAYIAKTEELLNMLIVLDNIVQNGSNITW